MSKLRSVSTAFWSDPFIEDLTTNQKLLFLYLITNEKTNMLGIYESSVKKISFETGIKRDEIDKGFKVFEKANKVKYINNYVILINYMKHQNFNTNMKKSAIDIHNNLPKELLDNKIEVSKDNPIESFETLLNHYGMVSKVEVEYEEEVKLELESKSEYEAPIFSDVNKLELFNLWIQYRKEIKKPIKSKISIKSLEAKFEEIEYEHLRYTIINSVNNGWQGLFFDKYTNEVKGTPQSLTDKYAHLI